jgi:hypothetical protein
MNLIHGSGPFQEAFEYHYKAQFDSLNFNFKCLFNFIANKNVPPIIVLKVSDY